MAELTLKSGDKQKDESSIAAEIGAAGIHIFVDQGFKERRGDIAGYFEGYMTEEEITNRTISDVRKDILRRTMRAAEFVYGHAPFGKGGERARFLRAMNAVSDLILIIEEAVDGDAPDEDVYLNCRDRWSKFKKLVPFTFDSQNTSINKSFTVSGGTRSNPETSGKPTA